MFKNLKIKPQYEHTKVGLFLFNLCAWFTEFLIKHRWLYYILACTWGILMTFIGILITGVLAIVKLFGANITFFPFYWIYGVKVGPDFWGGFEMGLMFCRDQKSSDSFINDHEWGHTFQNCLLGIFFPFVVAIPSATRYWYREIRSRKGKPNNKPYDSIWFEDSATQCGKYAVEQLAVKK